MTSFTQIFKPFALKLFLIAACAAFAIMIPGQGHAQGAGGTRPTLLITNQPVPPALRENLYSKPAQVREISPDELRGDTYFQPQQTVVSGKINDLRNELNNLQGKVERISAALGGLQRENEQKAANYYAAIATISTQLQSGTTPGNPRLTQRITQAEDSLENLGTSVSALNQIALDTSNLATQASYLLEASRATYGLSGAIEEDHVRLAELEDSINNTIVAIERILNIVNDDITRTSTYLSSERHNLRTLSLAVANGDLYGKSLGNRPFSNVGPMKAMNAAGGASMPADSIVQPAAAPGGPRPLVKIKFDKPNVDYEQPVYLAVNEALKRYPNARFELVAVHPTQGNAAQVAIESTKARRNAERVLRTLTQMGLDLDRIDLSYKDSAEISSSEVDLYVH